MTLKFMSRSQYALQGTLLFQQKLELRNSAKSTFMHSQTVLPANVSGLATPKQG